MSHRSLLTALLLLAALPCSCSDTTKEAALAFRADAGTSADEAWWDVRAGMGWDAVFAAQTSVADGQQGDATAPCRSDAECAASLGPLPACRLPRCNYETGMCEIGVASDNTSCDDDNACTLGDYCLSGYCSGVQTDCDDGDPCTLDSCDATSGACDNTVHEGACDDGDAETRDDRCIDGVCVGQPIVCDDDNECTVDTELADGTCSYDAAAADGLPCDDGEALTEEDRCASGICDGYVPGCDDGNPCTVDTLGGGGVCVHDPIAANGRECSDGNALTIDDACEGGVCVGTQVDCDDGNACTVDSFDALGEACVNDAVAANGMDCDDGDPATIEDRCNGGQCQGSTVACDDGDPCTLDSYNEASGQCVHDTTAANGALCDDGDLCTQDDRCTDGSCGGQALDCEDGNPCTDDSCSEGVCSHRNNTASCDDGVDCTVDDHCEGGACVGDDSGCGTCTPSYEDAVVRFTQIEVGPVGDRNALEPIHSLVDPEFARAIEDGDLHLLLEFPGPPLPLDDFFRVNAYSRVALSDASCDVMSDYCAYEVLPADLDATCQAVTYIDQVNYRQSDSLLGGGRSGLLVLRFTSETGADVVIPVEAPFLRAYAALEDGRLTGVQGLLYGVIRRTVLIQALEDIPTPISVPMETWLDSQIVWDTDLDGDGSYESATIDLRFQAIEARLRTPEAGLTCSELLSCLSACEDADSACRQDCVDSASPEGAQAFWDVVNCVQTNCPDGEQSCISEMCADVYLTCLYG